MTVETPDHYGGKPIPEDAIEIALAAEKKKKDGERENEGEENTEVETQETPLIVETNINPSYYIQIPGTDILIAKEETLKVENWENTHYKLAENGLFMPSPAIFMTYFVNVMDAAQGNLTLHDENNNPISRDEAEDLWKYLSTSHRGGCCTWLDAKFYREKRKWLFVKKGEWKIAYDHGTQWGSNGNNILVPQKTERLESTLHGECYVNLDFDRQGLPKSQSAHQKYKQRENICFWPPRVGRVARFIGNYPDAGLSCDANPSIYSSDIGVFACAEKSGGKQ